MYKIKNNEIKIYLQLNINVIAAFQTIIKTQKKHFKTPNDWILFMKINIKLFLFIMFTTKIYFLLFFF